MFENNTYMLIYGGKNDFVQECSVLGDLCLYDIHNNQWQAIA
jgi:hypothetical protein